MHRAALLPLALVLLAGCGGEPDPAPVPSPTPTGTRLEVEVRPEGSGGPVERRVVTEVPAGITAEDFEPVPGDVACIQVYGGPATAHVTGTLDGRRIDARFDRTDGCQMQRWDRLQSLLGRIPGPAEP